MLALFKKLRGDEISTVEDDTDYEINKIVIDPVDEETMRKNIEAKLEKYRPVERAANFTGPKFYR